MNANELRVGNIFHYGNSPIQEITINADILVSLLTNEGLLLIEKVFPIPLTEERLLKFGFNESEVCKGLYDIKNGNVTISISMDDTIVIDISIYNTNITGASIDISNHKYVHQLQNLYFALTGEELNY